MVARCWNRGMRAAHRVNALARNAGEHLLDRRQRGQHGLAARGWRRGGTAAIFRDQGAVDGDVRAEVDLDVSRLNRALKRYALLREDHAEHPRRSG